VKRCSAAVDLLLRIAKTEANERVSRRKSYGAFISGGRQCRPRKRSPAGEGRLFRRPNSQAWVPHSLPASFGTLDSIPMLPLGTCNGEYEEVAEEEFRKRKEHTVRRVVCKIRQLQLADVSLELRPTSLFSNICLGIMKTYESISCPRRASHKLYKVCYFSIPSHHIITLHRSSQHFLTCEI
jgi:hypothetical protein